MSTMAEKVAALLRLAGNNPNVNEAQAALEKARALMMEHHLEERDLPGFQQHREAVEIDIDTRIGEFPAWMGTLALTIAQAFRCDVYYASNVDDHMRRRTHIRVIGLPEDVAVVAELFPWIRGAAINLGVRYVQANGGQAEDYYIGFAVGIKRAFDEQAAAHQEWGLVLVKDPSVEELARYRGVTYSSDKKQRGFGYVVGEQDGYDVGRKRTVAP